MSEANASAAPAVETPAAPVAEQTPQATPTVVADAKATIADPNASKAEKVEAAKNIKEFKLKVYGKEVVDKFDINDEAELTKRLQKAHSFDRTAQEKAQMEKGVQQLIQALKENPRAVLTHPDISTDMKKFAQEILNELATEESKTPEQKEIEKLQKELQGIKDAEEKTKAEREAADRKRLEDDAERNLTVEVQDALKATGMSPSPRAVKYMAEYAAYALKNNINLSMNDIAPLVYKKMKQEYQEIVKSSSDDILDDFIDKDISARLPTKRLAKLKVAPDSANSIKTTGKTSKDAKEPEAPKKKKLSSWLND